MTNKSDQLRQRAELWQTRADDLEKETRELAERRYSDMDALIGIFAQSEREKLANRVLLWSNRDTGDRYAHLETANKIQSRGELAIEQKILSRVRRAEAIKNRTLATGAARVKKYRDKAARLLEEANRED